VRPVRLAEETPTRPINGSLKEKTLRQRSASTINTKESLKRDEAHLRRFGEARLLLSFHLCGCSASPHNAPRLLERAARGF
jgi:hypothetical protein